MTTLVEIVTSPNCPHSPRAVRLAQKAVEGASGVLVHEVNTITAWGAERANEYGVQQTPTILINGRVVFVGVPPIARLKELLARAAFDEKERGKGYF